MWNPRLTNLLRAPRMEPAWRALPDDCMHVVEQLPTSTYTKNCPASSGVPPSATVTSGTCTDSHVVRFQVQLLGHQISSIVQIRRMLPFPEPFLRFCARPPSVAVGTFPAFSELISRYLPRRPALRGKDPYTTRTLRADETDLSCAREPIRISKRSSHRQMPVAI